MNPAAVKLIEKLPRLSTVPNVYSRVNAAVNDPNSQAAKVGEIISSDQALTAQLLRLVNSAFYGFPGKVDNVSRAVTIVGFKQTRELVLAASIMKNFKGEGGLINMEEFWKHSLAVATISKIIAEVSGNKKHMEALFTAGLMHDIGRLIMMEKSDEIDLAGIFETAKSQNMPVYKVEKAKAGFSHNEVGEALASKWNLPPLLRETIAFHHTPARALQFKPETAIVHLAEVLAHTMSLGNSGDEAVPILDTNVLKTLTININSLDQVADQTSVLYPDMLKTFLE